MGGRTGGDTPGSRAGTPDAARDSRTRRADPGGARDAIPERAAEQVSPTAPPVTTVPDSLAGTYREAVPAARAVILARLWGALAREPIDGVLGSRQVGPDLVITLADGRELTGPADAAQPFAHPGPGLTIRCGGTGYADPAALVRALDLPGETARFASELNNSVTNLALAAAARPEPRGGVPTLAWLAGQQDVEPLIYLEQSVVDSHPLHPLALTRTGLSAREVLAYAPEHRPVVSLPVLRVPEDRWLTTGRGLPPELPVHPWQRERTRDRHPWLRPTGEQILARPLMALRTLAPLADPRWHLKTSLDVHMTSLSRLLPPSALYDGPALSAMLADLGARAGVTVLAEVAAGAALVDGTPSRSLAVLRRQTPVRHPGELLLPLAALAAPSPASGHPLVTEVIRLGYRDDPRPFVADLARALLPPLLRLLHAGVALDAQGQNTLIGLREWRPVRSLYRDLGGVRLSPARLANCGVPVCPLHGRLATDDADALRNRLAAAALSTGIGQLAVLLAAEYGMPPASVWRQVAAVVRGTYRELPRDAAEDAAALFAPTLPVTASTAMRLAPAPVREVWARLPNPLAEWA